MCICNYVEIYIYFVISYMTSVENCIKTHNAFILYKLKMLFFFVNGILYENHHFI